MPKDLEPSPQPQPPVGVDIDAFWRTGLPRLRRRALRLAGGQADLADDMVSATLLKLVTYLSAPDRPVQDLEALVFITLRTVAYDHWRRRGRESDLCVPLDEPSAVDSAVAETVPPEDALVARESYHRLIRAVEREPPGTRTLFRLRFVEERSYSEIAAELRISEVLARKRVQTLRRRLRVSTEENVVRTVTRAPRTRPLRKPQRDAPEDR